MKRTEIQKGQHLAIRQRNSAYHVEVVDPRPYSSNSRGEPRLDPSGTAQGFLAVHVDNNGEHARYHRVVQLRQAQGSWDDHVAAVELDRRMREERQRELAERREAAERVNADLLQRLGGLFPEVDWAGYRPPVQLDVNRFGDGTAYVDPKFLGHLLRIAWAAQYQGVGLTYNPEES